MIEGNLIETLSPELEFSNGCYMTNPYQLKKISDVQDNCFEFKCADKTAYIYYNTSFKKYIARYRQDDRYSIGIDKNMTLIVNSTMGLLKPFQVRNFYKLHDKLNNGIKLTDEEIAGEFNIKNEFDIDDIELLPEPYKKAYHDLHQYIKNNLN